MKKSQEDLMVEGKKIHLTHLDKILFPKSKISKGEFVEYYSKIAPIFLPHALHRPLTMHRFLKGVDQEGFFQKEVSSYYPEWVEQTTLKKEGGEVTHALINNKATLLYLANQDCIEMHLALSLTKKILFPDRLIFDLDPPDRGFAKVRYAALELKKLLDHLGLISFLQLTGSRGIHVVVPLDSKAEFSTTHLFAKELAGYLAHSFPKKLTVAQRKEGRGARVFVDYSRNSYGQASIAPYSIRAKEKAPVATPIFWEELNDKKLTAQSFTIKNIFQRLEKEKDPWATINQSAQSLQKAIRTLAKLTT